MSGVSTSDWCTNWGAYNTPRLWAMVEHEDKPEAWAQVGAWEEISDSVDAHRAALSRARDALTAAWPPEQNEASRAFVAQLDILLARMDGAREDARTTSAGLANILQALRQAKLNIEPLWREYESKRNDMVPAWWDEAEVELDRKAQAHMIAAEREVEQYVPQLKVPTPYELIPPQGRVGGSDRDDPGSGASGGAGSTGSARAAQSVPVPHNPPPPMPGLEPTIPEGVGPRFGSPGANGHGAPPAPPSEGPTLSELINPPPPPPVPNPLPQPPPIGPGSGGHPPVGIGGHGLFPVTGGNVPPVGLPNAGGGLRPFAGGGRGAMPAGSVIGGAPAIGAGAAGGLPAARPAPPAWLPGGLGQPGAAAHAGVAGMPGAGPGKRGENSDRGLAFDADNPWAVAGGVDPVIEPSRHRARHDPGPGVIGWRG